jgi:uncharacterized protein YrzB (UPF0473 family)
VEEMERDLIVFEDEDGSETVFELLTYFDHKGQEYAVLIEADEDAEAEEDPDAERGVCIVKVETNGDAEEYSLVDEDEADELFAIVEEMFGDCDCDCDEEGGCDCCHGHEE